MHVASLELCKQLFELSGWDTEKWYHFWPKNDGSNEHVVIDKGSRWYDEGEDVGYHVCAAYDLGYLLRKLPPVIQDPDDKVFKHFQLWVNGDSTVHAGYVEPYAHDDKVAFAQSADTPEDVLSKLCIELFKSGVLKKGEV